MSARPASNIAPHDPRRRFLARAGRSLFPLLGLLLTACLSTRSGGPATGTPAGIPPPVLAGLPALQGFERLDGGRVLAVDRGGNRLLVLDDDGGLLEIFGGSGRGLGSWSAPGEADARLGLQVLVADRDNRRLVQLDSRLAALGETPLPAGLGDDFSTPDLLAISAGRSLVVADARLGGVVARGSFGDWRSLLDFSRLGRRLRPAALEVLGETVYLLDRPASGPPRLLRVDVAGGVVQERAWPGLLGLHRSGERGLRLLAVEDGDLVLRHWPGAALLGGLPAGPGLEEVRWSPAPALPPLRDFLLQPAALLLAPEGRPPLRLPRPEPRP